MKVGIVGREGLIGSFVSSVCEEGGFEVSGSDKGWEEDPREENTDLFNKSDVLGIAVPLDQALSFSENVLDPTEVETSRSVAAILDFSSDQVGVAHAIRSFEAQMGCDLSAVGIHFMFKPTPDVNLQGKNVLVTVYTERAKSDPRVENFLSFLENQGASVIHVDSPEEHDRIVSFVQGAVLSVVVSHMYLTETKKNVFPQDHCSREQEVLKDFGRRIFSPDMRDVYTNLLLNNSANGEVVESLIASIGNLADSIGMTGECGNINSYLDEMEKQLHPFLPSVEEVESSLDEVYGSQNEEQELPLHVILPTLMYGGMLLQNEGNLEKISQIHTPNSKAVIKVLRLVLNPKRRNEVINLLQQKNDFSCFDIYLSKGYFGCAKISDHISAWRVALIGELDKCLKSFWDTIIQKDCDFPGSPEAIKRSTEFAA